MSSLSRFAFVRTPHFLDGVRMTSAPNAGKREKLKAGEIIEDGDQSKLMAAFDTYVARERVESK